MALSLALIRLCREVRREKRRRLPRVAPPVIEPLESRLFLSAISWTGGTGDWNTGSNWSTGIVPGPADDATLPAGANVTISTNADPGTLTTAAGSHLTLKPGEQLNENGGTIGGFFEWDGFVIGSGSNLFTVAGTTIMKGRAAQGNFANGGNLTINGGGASGAGVQFTNNASATVTGGVALGNTATITNSVGATFTITDDSGFVPTVGFIVSGGTFINQGTFTKSGGTGISAIPQYSDLSSNAGAKFENVGGTVNIDSGTFAIHEIAALQDGQLNITSGATLDIDSTFPTTYYAVQLSGTLTAAGGGRISLGVDSFLAQAADGTPANATLDFPAGMVQAAGSIIGAGSGTVTNTGFLDFAGSVNPAQVNLVNQGTVNVVGNTNVELGNFVNAPTGVLDLQTDAGLIPGPGFAFNLTNQGTIRKSGESGNSIITASFFSDAGNTLDIQTGTLSFQEGSIDLTAGPISIASGAVLNFDTSGAVYLSGTFTSTGAGTVTVTNGYLTGPDANHGQDHSKPATINFAPNTLFLQGGFIDDNAYDNIINAGSMYVPSGGQLASFTNTGSVFVGDGQILITKGEVITNAAGGLFDFTAAPTVVGALNDIFINQGTLLVSAGDGLLDLSAVYPFDSFINGPAFMNTGGTVEVASGTLELAAVTFGDPGVISSGQGYRLDAGASLITDVADPITTNNGTVILGGAGVIFPDIAAIAINNRHFEVDSGGSFTTVGSLTSDGTLTVGGDLTVTGNLSVSGPAAVLAFAVGAPPGTSGAPDLQVLGQTTLDGSLTATLANGFGTGAGASYSVATFAKPTVGGFASTAGVGPDFTPVITSTSIHLTSTGSGSADLAVSGITAPASISPGSAATITWQVTSQGATPAAGTWRDSVYLTTDGVIDESAILLGRVSHTGPLAINAAYTGTLQATMPAVPVGTYEIVVLVDSGDEVFDVNRSNNQSASAPLTSSIPALSLGETTNGNVNVNQDFLYVLTLPAGTDVSLAATFGTGLEADLHVRYGSIPTTTTWDESLLATTALSANLLIPDHQAGNYYILVHGREGSGAGPAFTLTPIAISAGPQSFTPNFGGTNGAATVTITGTGFDGTTTAALVSGSTTIHASQIQLISANTLLATFSLIAWPTGSYALAVTEDTTTFTLLQPFTIQPPTRSGLAFNLALPGDSRGDLANTAYLTYTNTGNTDIPAPYFFIYGNNVAFKLPGQAQYSDDSVELLGIAPTGAAGTLAPGESNTIPITYVQAQIVDDQNVDISVSEVDPGDLIDLSVLKQDLMPANEPVAAWNIIYANFLAKVGSNLGGLAGVLRNAANALSAQGTYTGDVDQLLNYALEAAGDFGQITQRFTLGVFGRGQADPYDKAIAADANGNVTITAGGQERIFLIQPNGTYRGVNGDNATLTNTAGIFTLKESTGELTVFNADGTLNYYQDNNGNRLAANYTSGLLTSLVASDGDTYTFTYNSFGRITQVTDPVGQVNTYTYDSTGQLLMSIAAPDGTTSFSYVTDPSSPSQFATASISYADGTHRFYTYDSFGRLITETRDGGAEAETYNYDGVGNTVTSTDALGRTSTTVYGPTDAPAEIEDGLGDIARIAYDPDGRPTSATSAGGLSTTNTYDAEGNAIASTDAAGNMIKFSYDATLDKLLSLTDPNGNTTTYGYDANGNLTSVTDAAGGHTDYSYNANGAVTQITSPATGAKIITYDSHGLVTSRSYSDGTSITYTYDSHRNLLTATDASGTVSYTYNTANLVTEVDYPDGEFLKFTYDAAGRRTSMTDQTGFTTNYLYDSLGRLSEMTDAANAPIATFTYDAVGDLIQQTNANGAYTIYSFDATGDQTGIVNHAADGSINSSFISTYDVDGQPTSVTSLSGTTNYAYDAIGQLVEVVLPGGRTITYAYDADGNRTTVSDTAAAGVTYSSNNVNEYITVGATTYTYDADGNLTSSTTAGVTTTYIYNARNQLVSMASPTDTYTFGYDPLGERIATTHNGVTSENLIDPAGNLVGQFSPGGAVIAHYTYGAGLISSVDASGNATFYDFDSSGNTADITGVEGAVSASYTYLPFGQILSQTGSTPQPFTFGGTAGVVSAGNGVYLMPARSYDSSTGRFMQRDPVNIDGGDTNLYRYAGNDPIGNIDPSGLVSIGILSDRAATLFGRLGEEVGQVMLTPQICNRIPLYMLQNLQESLTVAAAKATVDKLVSGVKAALGDQLATATTSALGGTPVSAALDSLAAQTVANAEVQAGNISRAIAQKMAITGAENTIGIGADQVIAQTGVNLGTGIGFGGIRAFFNSPLDVVSSGLGGIQVGYDYLKAVADADRFNREFPDGIPLNVEEVLGAKGYASTINKPLVRQMLLNALRNGLVIDDEFIANAIKQQADLIRLEPEPPPPTITIVWPTEFFNGIDPNSIIGPAGFGAAGFVPVDQTFPYTITFENEPTAGAPAKVVTINQQLDSNLDWSTFALGNMGFGAFTVNVPAGLQSYQTSVSVSASLRVDISAQFNALTGHLSWTFTSIDPATGDLPAEALAGFLPPDDAAGDGEGFVTYHVAAKSPAATGTTIHAQAQVVFDGNAPINTANLLNTIDAGAPTSSAHALPANETRADFPVTWSGSDDTGGSGIAAYNIFVSIDGGPQTLWLAATRATAGVYPGQPGHSYGFSTQAIDNVGNTEAQHATVDTTTTLASETITLTPGSKTGKTTFTDAAGDTVTFALTGTVGSVTLIRIGAHGQPGDLYSLTATGTNATSGITITTPPKLPASHDLTISNVTITGSLKGFTAATTDVFGAFIITGSLSTLALGNLAANAAVTIGPAALATAEATITLGHVDGASLTSATAIKSLTAIEWTNAQNALETILAPEIDKLAITGIPKTATAGDFTANLIIAGPTQPKKRALGTVTIGGTVADGTWNVTGDTGTLAVGAFGAGWVANISGAVGGLSTTVGALSGSLTAKLVKAVTVKTDLANATMTLSEGVDPKNAAVGTLTVGGSITGTTVNATGNIGAVKATAITGSTIFAGVTPGTLGLPASLGALGNTAAAITSVTVSGSKAKNPPASFLQSFIAAGNIGKVSLGVVNFGDSGVPFGFAAKTIGSYSRAGLAHSLTKLTVVGAYDQVQDYLLWIV